MVIYAAVGTRHSFQGETGATNGRDISTLFAILVYHALYHNV